VPSLLVKRLGGAEVVGVDVERLRLRSAAGHHGDNPLGGADVEVVHGRGAGSSEIGDVVVEVAEGDGVLGRRGLADPGLVAVVGEGGRPRGVGDGLG
jgi:hypothetical protein